MQAQYTVIRAIHHEPPVARDGLAHVDRDGLRDREFGIALERAEHVLGVMTGSACVPETESGDSVGVHVLGRTLEFGEHGEVVPSVLGERMCDLEQHGAVALHDEGAV